MERTIRTTSGLKATTLVETLVALVLITLSFSIGVTVFIKVTESTGTDGFIQAYWYTEEYLHEWETKHGQIPTEIVLADGCKLKSEEKVYSDNVQLLIVDVYNAEDKKIYSRKKIVPIHAE
jgi:hypothetical protein